MTSTYRSKGLGKSSYKIIFLGDVGVGKTCIIERFVNNVFDATENSTIGIDFIGKSINYKGSRCRLQLWDTAGQEKFKSLIPSYLKDAMCAIFVMDVSNGESLRNIESWIRLYKEYHNPKSIALFCGNKCDLEMQLDRNLLESLMEKYKMPYHTVSAKTGYNIEGLFTLVVDMISFSQEEDGKTKVKVSKNEDQEGMEFPCTVQSLEKGPLPSQKTVEEGSQNLKLTEAYGTRKCCNC